MSDDWFMRQLEFLPKNLPTIKQTNDDPLIDIEDEITGEKRSVPLTQLLLEKIIFLKIAEAEDILFDNLDKLSNSQIESITNWFYTKIDNLSDHELIEGGFSREEINQGINDIQFIIGDL